MATKPPIKKPPLQRGAVKKEPFNLAHAFDKLLFTTSEQQAFLEDLATLVDDGVPANRAIEVLGRVEKGPKRTVADYITSKISQGRPIAEGMQGWFAPAVVELVRAGEQGGTLAQNIHMAAESMGSRSETFSSLASSLTYPIVVIIAACAVLIYLNGSVFPQFAAIKPVEQWPSNGQQLIKMAIFLQNWWFMVIVAIVVAFVGFSIVLKNSVGDLRRSLDSLPPFNIYRQLTAAQFMETLGLLIANGVVFKQALKIVEQQASPYLLWHLVMMELRLGRGRGNIAEVLDTGLISDADIVRLKAIADAKGFEHALVRLGKAAAQRGTETVRKIGRILGSFLLVVAAGFAGFMIMGLYSVGSSLS